MQSNDNLLAVVGCGVLVGVDAVAVTIEATMRGRSGPPRILGSVDAVVREAYHRALGAFVAQGLPSPRGTALLNFAPAELRKCGAGFDLPMALALAGADGIVPARRLAGVAAFGELTLDGRVRSVPGVVPIAIALRDRGYLRLLAHPDDARRAAVVPGIDAVEATTLREAIQGVASDGEVLPVAAARDAHAVLRSLAARGPELDLSDLRGHETPKKALAVAAAGRHDLLFAGPPGSGKSALLRRLGDLLPEVDRDECLDVLKIHSIAGVETALCRSGRPFRAPHHSSSGASVLGGGIEPRPGEVTLAQHGVLFLDELPEFRREVLEGLRQPLEERRVTIGRVRRTLTLPADFQLVAAMNPCPCGHYGDGSHACQCSTAERHRYRARISGPLLDRFDLRVTVPSLPPEAFRRPRDTALGTAALRARVAAAVLRQDARNAGGAANGRLDGPQLDAVVGEDPAVHAALDTAMRAFGMSGRGRVRVLRVARTLADLDGSDPLRPIDVQRAVRLRALPV